MGTRRAELPRRHGPPWGCGSGQSLRYLADRGACELWGVDLSAVQLAFAEETLRPFAERVKLIASPMEVNPGYR